MDDHGADGERRARLRIVRWFAGHATLGYVAVTTRSVAPESDRRLWLPWTLLAVGTFVASFSAILIRYAQEAEPLAIAFWRCFLGAAVLAPFALRGVNAMPRPAFRMPAVAGAFLAVHFATWITSLELTSIASSVLLVSTTPVFVALASWWLWRARLNAVVWVGIVLAMLGAGLIGGGDRGGSSLVGDALALAGGATAGGYALAGSIARRDLGILEYAVVAYGTSAVLVLVVCVAGDVPLSGYAAETWWAIAAIVVGPQLLGHTLINFVLRDIDATSVAVVLMAEPLIAVAAAFALFGEVPSLLVYPGGVAILVGIYLVSQRVKSPVVVVE